MKRMTPLKAKKHPSEMERYVKARQKKAKSASPAKMITELHEPFHDPEGDMYHLAKAQEIMSDPKRHKDAVKVARVKIKNLSRIA